jgi:two-component system CheB/CheR fusion protein
MRPQAGKIFASPLRFVLCVSRKHLANLEKYPMSLSIFRDIFALLRESGLIDLSAYKASAVGRRIRRRMEATQHEELSSYRDHLRASPEEQAALSQSILIGVTDFFREPESFEVLRTHLERILSQKRPGEELRIWSAGCSTGQEAYSLAMLAAEVLGASLHEYPVKIFATDTNSDFLQAARAGIYDLAQMAGVPEAYRARYFIEEAEGRFRVRESLRSLLLFTEHDLLRNPPFLRQDIICCRNLLIYLRTHLQHHLAQLFHYSLHPGGVLMLGRAESFQPYPYLFDTLDRRHQIYRKNPFRQNDRQAFWFSPFELQLQEAQTQQKSSAIAQQIAAMIHHGQDHPFVVLDRQQEILHTYGSLRLYLEPASLARNSRLSDSLNPELRLYADLVLRQASHRQGVGIFSPYIPFRVMGASHIVRLVAYALSVETQLFVLLFEAAEASAFSLLRTSASAGGPDEQSRLLEEELRAAREYLEVYHSELDRVNRELSELKTENLHTHEDLKIANEELEATNEELRTLNESLFHNNEQYRLINDEMKERERFLAEARSQAEGLAQHLSLAQEFYEIGSWELDFVTGRTYNSPYVYRLFGYKPGEIEPGVEELARRLHPDDREQALRLIQDAIRQRVPYKTEYRIHRKNDGQFRWIRDAARIIQDAEGRPVKMIGLNMDITEEKELSEAREKAYQFYRSIVESVDIPMIIHSDFRVRFANRAMLRLIRASGPEHIVGLSVLDYTPVPYQKAARRRMERMYLLRENNPPAEIRILRLDGSEVEVENAGVAIEYEGQAAALSTFQDISERKRHIQQLKEAESRFQKAQEIGNVGSWEWDFATSTLWFSETMEKIMGHDATEAGLPSSLIHPEDQERVVAAVNEAIAGTGSLELDIRVILPSGELRYLTMSAELFRGEQGEPLRLFGVTLDMTERKRVEEEIRVLNQALEQRVQERTLQLAESNAELERFAYSVSHDLRVPLRHLISYTNLLKSRLREQLSGDAEEFMGFIVSAAQKMNHLVESLLSYSRIVRTSLALRWINMGALVNNLIELVSLGQEERSIQFVLGEMPPIYGDETLIEQAMTNLLSNAVKYTRNEAEARIEVWGEQGPEAVTYIVRDNGVGFDMKYYQQLFGVFQRLHTESEFEGIGIGLANVHRVALRHGGRVWAEGKVGEGASFYLQIPNPEN